MNPGVLAEVPAANIAISKATENMDRYGKVSNAADLNGSSANMRNCI